MIDAAAFEREVRELHEFFERWYTGTAAPSEINRLNVLDPSFVMIAPDGRSLSADAVRSSIVSIYGQRAMGIEIRNVTVNREGGFGTYEEWQTFEGAVTGRVSTAVMVPSPDAPNGLRWIHLHETWLPDARP